MPLIEHSQYQPSHFLYKNPHISTIYVGRVKKTKPPIYKRERLELEDGDFLDVDYHLKSPKKAVILCHGLEGNSTRTYNNTSATYFLNQNFTVFAWNNRSCSGEMNRLPRLYHHAVVEDLEKVVNWVIEQGFEEIFLLGFSMGGAQILNYLGTKEVNPKIKSGVAVSAPVQLKSSAEILKRGFNQVYLKNLLSKISKKLKEKSEQYPELLDWDKLKNIRTFDEVDEYFTAPLHGFLDKEDYYKRASPGFVMHNIKIPVLILNALDDPFLGKACYPYKFAKEHSFVYLETPKHGGHCAFPQGKTIFSYSEMRAFKFFEDRETSKL